jgi:mono/diheme cytochrome c family protein
MFDPIYHFLSQIGYRHPIHPTEVHMPIGLVVGAVIFASIALLFRRRNLARTARHCIILAFIWLFPTMLLGFMDWQHFYAGAWLFPIKIKLMLAVTLLILLFIAILVSSRVGEESKSALATYCLCFLTVVALGYFGGQMVYGARTPASPEEFQAGERIYNANCSACHPQGGNIINPNLPLRNAPQLAELSTFIDFIRNPHNPDGSKGIMPAFPVSRISDEQGNRLYEYILNVLAKRQGSNK